MWSSLRGPEIPVRPGLASSLARLADGLARHFGWARWVGTELDEPFCRSYFGAETVVGRGQPDARSPALQDSTFVAHPRHARVRLGGNGGQVLCFVQLSSSWVARGGRQEFRLSFSCWDGFSRAAPGRSGGLERGWRFGIHRPWDQAGGCDGFTSQC